jgi:hypothetical protein
MRGILLAAHLYGNFFEPNYFGGLRHPLFRQKIHAHYFIFGIAPNVPAC